MAGHERRGPARGGHRRDAAERRPCLRFLAGREGQLRSRPGYGEALLTGGDGLAAAQADLTEPETVLGDPTVRSVIDMTQPTAIILAAVLHFLPARSAAAVCAGYVSRAARGSWLIVSCGHYPDEELAARLQQTATHARFWNHDAADLASFLAGLEPVAPGVCEARKWIAGTGGVPSGKNAYALAAVGAKPQ